MSLVIQADGIRLDPDESRASEWGFLQFIPLPHPEPSQDYVQAVAREMGARVPASPPLTWTHWYQFFHNISEELFLENLGSLEAHRDFLPFQMVELDDGYQAAWGDWTTTNIRFPHGLADLSEDQKERLYSWLVVGSFTVEPGAMVHQHHPDWLLKDKRGKLCEAQAFSTTSL
jgi:alpha-galactosidase